MDIIYEQPLQHICCTYIHAQDTENFVKSSINLKSLSNKFFLFFSKKRSVKSNLNKRWLEAKKGNEI